MAFPFLDVQLVLRLLNYDIELRKKKTKVITYYILGQIYYILRYFGFLHFASKVITFWVIEVITFCVESYYILGYYYILRQKLLHFGLLLHFGSIITFCGVTFLPLTNQLASFPEPIPFRFTYFYRAFPVNKYPRNSLARTYQFGVLDNKSLIRRFVV